MINTYVPLKFNYSDNTSFTKFIKDLEKSDFVISEQTIDGKRTDLNLKPILSEVNEAIINTTLKDEERMTQFKNTFNNFSDEKLTDLNVAYPVIEENSPTIKNENSILLDFLDTNISLSPQNIKYTLYSKMLSYTGKQLNELVINTNISSQYFGHELTFDKKVLILWPILFIDINDNQQIASVSIEFYEYGMAILKISYPIKNQTSYPLEQNIPDLYHKSCYYNTNTNNRIKVEDFDYHQLSNNSIYSVIDIILNWLDKNSVGFTRSENKEIIQLNQLKPKNINIKQAKKEEKEALFRIVNAPVTDGIKLHPERNKVWDDQYWGNEYSRYLFSSMGKCVAIPGHNISNSLPEDTSKEEFDAIINRDLLMNVEDAYKVMLLNRINSVNYLLKQNEAGYRDLKTFEEDYHLTENYILGLLDFSFGTVRDLYSTIENVCSEYLNKKSLDKRFQNNQQILSNRQQERVTKENDRLSILGVLITILVSFPAIYETLAIFQKELINSDISYVNVFGLSIFFEVILIFYLFYWYKNRKK